jgi:hypothetical protein
MSRHCATRRLPRGRQLGRRRNFGAGVHAPHQSDDVLVRAARSAPWLAAQSAALRRNCSCGNHSGGALRLEGSTVTLDSCVFDGNQARRAAAVAVLDAKRLCVQAAKGGAVSAYLTTLRVSRCNFSRNWRGPRRALPARGCVIGPTGPDAGHPEAAAGCTSMRRARFWRAASLSRHRRCRARRRPPSNGVPLLRRTRWSCTDRRCRLSTRRAASGRHADPL